MKELSSTGKLLLEPPLVVPAVFETSFSILHKLLKDTLSVVPPVNANPVDVVNELVKTAIPHPLANLFAIFVVIIKFPHPIA